MRFAILSRSTAALAVSLALAAPMRADPAHWPSLHGAHARGVGPGTPPIAWDLTTGENVRFQVSLPGLAHASPVIWGDRIYVVTVTSAGPQPELRVGLYGDITPAKDQEIVHTWWLYAFDRATGTLVWKRELHRGTPATKRHIKATHANSTPTTDGEHIVVFLGSEGLHCLDRNGKRLWRKDFGVLDAGYYMIPAAQWGFASSPVIEDGKVVVLAEVQKNSFLAVLDVATGEEIWKIERDDVPSWSTPTVIGRGAEAQIVINGFKHTGGYSFTTGAERWRMSKYGGDVPVPRPVAGDGMVYLTNGHGRSPVVAVRSSARGDITLAADKTSNQGVAWASPKGGAYMQTPILQDGRLYVCNDNGLLSVFDAATGEMIYKARLTKSGEGFTASGVAAGGHLYYPSENGEVHVVKAGPSFELLGVHSLGEVTMATPAIAENILYFRTRHHLIAIGETGQVPQNPEPASEKPQPPQSPARGRSPR